MFLSLQTISRARLENITIQKIMIASYFQREMFSLTSNTEERSYNRK